MAPRAKKTPTPTMPSELAKAVKGLSEKYVLTEREAVENLRDNTAIAAPYILANTSAAPLADVAKWWLDACEVYAAHNRVKECRKADITPDPVDLAITQLGASITDDTRTTLMVTTPSEGLRVAIADAKRQFGCRSDDIKAAAIVAERRPTCDHGVAVAAEAVGYVNYLFAAYIEGRRTK